MRRPSLYLDRRETLDVKMTPMIDVVFLLLVFFVWTASFQVVERILPSSISQAATGAEQPSDLPPPPEADFPEVTIHIVWTSDGPRWRVNSQRFSQLEAVKARLQQIFEINEAAPVVIHPDAGTPLGHVIDIYDTARLVGFSEIQFAVSETRD